MADLSFSVKLWGDICADVDPEPEDTTEYEFSNGRKFKRDGSGVLRGE